ncbi:hypothetical protein JCM3765_005562 [Sporobolomyces pararoseus]
MPKRMSKRQIAILAKISANKLVKKAITKPPICTKFDEIPFSIEDAEDDPAEYRPLVNAQVWEQVQVEVMNQIYSGDGTHSFDDGRDMKVCLLGERSISDMYFQGILIARAHRDISQALLDTTYGRPLTFEPHWMKDYTVEEREKIILTALEETTKFTVGYGLWSRRLCPDLTVSKLAREEDGLGFVKLVRHICQSAITFKSQEDYYAVPCRAFDEYYEIEREPVDDALPLPRSKRTFQTDIQHDRNWFIARFVLVVLQILDIVPWDFITATLVQKARKPMERCERHFVRGDSAVGTTCSCELCSELRTEACAACRRCEAEIPEGKSSKLFYCKACLNIDPPYKVPYCSRDCQRIDWKEGKHKERCGKRLTDLAFPPLGWRLLPPLPPPCLSLQSVYRDPVYIYNLFEANGSPYHRNEGEPPDFRGALSLSLLRKDLSWEGKLLDRAIETRDEKDIKAFVIGLAREIGSVDFIMVPFLDQASVDWGIERDQVEEWIETGFKEHEEFEVEWDLLSKYLSLY